MEYVLIENVDLSTQSGGNPKIDPVMPSARALITALLIICSVSIAYADATSDDQTSMDLGRKVLAVMEAIQDPEEPNAMRAVTELGRDQRYYVMVRGWLSYQLEGDMSILAATGGQAPHEVRERIRFLKKAIRAVDLE